jgi:hypothetical protein
MTPLLHRADITGNLGDHVRLASCDRGDKGWTRGHLQLPGSQGMQSRPGSELINHALAFEAGEAKVQHDSG